MGKVSKAALKWDWTVSNRGARGRQIRETSFPSAHPKQNLVQEEHSGHEEPSLVVLSREGKRGCNVTREHQLPVTRKQSDDPGFLFIKQNVAVRIR